MNKKMTVDEALEWMRDQNRKDPHPCPEDSFEETLQGLARPMMEAGLIEDVGDELIPIEHGLEPIEWDENWTMGVRIKEPDPIKFCRHVLGEPFDSRKKEE